MASLRVANCCWLTVTIELLQQIVFQRNGKTDDFGHGYGRAAAQPADYSPHYWPVEQVWWTVLRGRNYILCLLPRQTPSAPPHTLPATAPAGPGQSGGTTRTPGRSGAAHRAASRSCPRPGPTASDTLCGCRRSAVPGDRPAAHAQGGRLAEEDVLHCRRIAPAGKARSASRPAGSSSSGSAVVYTSSAPASHSRAVQ